MNEQKSVLDLALELGVRSETILQAMRDMGLSADQTATFDADQESVVIDQMAESGAISAALIKGKGRRKLTDEPVVDDALLTEALGASENGFSDANVPRKILFESGFEKKSLFQKWFGKKKDIANSLKDNPISEDAVDRMFSRAVAPQAERELSPFQEIEARETEPAAAEETPAVKKKSPKPQPVEEEISPEELEGIEDLEIDEDLLGNMEDMEDIEIDGDEGLEDIAAEDLEDLGEMTEGDLDGVDLDGMDMEGIEGDEDLEMDLDEADMEDMAEGDEDAIPGMGDEEDYAPGFIERMFARIQLTPTEMWALMIGSLATMLVLLGVTVYWWLFTSPKAMNDLLDEANTAYTRALGKEMPEWQEGRIVWEKPRGSFQTAADLYAEYINKFSGDYEKIQEAYKKMCDCYYQIAMGDKKEEAAASKADEKLRNRENKENAFRDMALYYDKYLGLLESIADLSIGLDPQNPQNAYPKVAEQQEALYRISLAKRELGQFDQTIKSLEEFVDRFRESDQALEAMIEIGNSYKEWSESKTDEELNLLEKAIKQYGKSLDVLNTRKPDDFLQRMNLYAKIGDIQYRLYERSKENNKDDEANRYLSEVIANYELSADEARKQALKMEQDPPKTLLERNTMRSDIQRVRKRLGDLYLLRGREAGVEWKQYEVTAEPFPDSIVHKQQLMEAAKREQETAKRYLQQANTLYDQLLTDKELLLKNDFEDILYNKAEAFYIMREYPQAIAAGEQLLQASGSRELTDETDTKTKILYLLGNAAWEQAKVTNDYTRVKKYYYDALKQDPLYPKDDKGDTSHLADIRLNNAFYLRGANKNYPKAIERFDKMVRTYPESGYAYLTLYWYGKALEEYGDQLSAQARKLREEAKSSGSPGTLIAQAEKLEDDKTGAKHYYGEAVAKYNRAIETRDTSEYVDYQNERYLKEIMFNRGHSAFKKGDYRKAEDYYKEALERYGNDNTAEQFKPLAIERLGDLNDILFSYDQAIKYYKQYLDNAYENSQMRVTEKLAEAYRKRFSWEEAREWYRKIINNDPAVPSDNQAERNLRTGNKAPKGPGFRALKRIADSHLSEALTYSDDGQKVKMEEALKAYGNLAAKYPLGPDNDQRTLPDDADSLRMVAMIQFDLEKYAESAKSYDQFLKMDPTFSRKGLILYKMGQAYMKIGEADKAIDSLDRITEDSVDNSSQFADTLLLLGQAFQKKASQFLEKEGDEALYTRYLQRAQRTFNRVQMTNQPEKIKQANMLNAAIESVIQSRAVVSTAGQK